MTIMNWIFKLTYFLKKNKPDEEELLGHFNLNNSQAVCWAIQSQICYWKIY